MDAGSVRDAISCGLQTRVSLIDLGACKISPRACLIDSDESDGQALDANECFNVEQYCARGARLEDLWAVSRWQEYIEERLVVLAEKYLTNFAVVLPRKMR